MCERRKHAGDGALAMAPRAPVLRPERWPRGSHAGRDRGLGFTTDADEGWRVSSLVPGARACGVLNRVFHLRKQTEPLRVPSPQLCGDVGTARAICFPKSLPCPITRISIVTIPSFNSSNWDGGVQFGTSMLAFLRGGDLLPVVQLASTIGAPSHLLPPRA